MKKTRYRFVLMTFGLVGIGNFFPSVTQAYLARTAVSSLKAGILGIYTTADATCQTGWIASFDLKSSATATDFVNSPTLGSGKAAIPTNCILIVMLNSIATTVKAGTYSDTSAGSSDSVCNSGVSDVDRNPCGNGVTPVWPTQVTTDAANIGLTLTTACTGVDSEIIPVYLSLNSACSGLASKDKTNSLCQNAGGTGPVAFSPPETTSSVLSSANGFLLNRIPNPSGAQVRFVIDPDSTMGGNGSTCVSLVSPRMYISQ